MQGSSRSLVGRGAPASLALLFLAAHSGCLRPRPYAELPPPPSEDLRAQFGKIGVRWEALPPSHEIQTPARGWDSGMGRGAVLGMIIGFYIVGSLAHSGGGGRDSGWIAALLILIFLPLIPLCTLGGAIYGAAAAPSAEEVDRGLAALFAATERIGVQAKIRDRVLARARQRTDASVAPLDPTASARDCDTILEIGAPAVLLHGPWQINPALTFRIHVPVRLVRAADGALLHSFALAREGDTREFAAWTENDAAAFRADLGAGVETFSERIVEEIFLLYILPVKRPIPAREAP